MVAAPVSQDEVEDLLERAEAWPTVPLIVLGPVPGEERLVEALAGRPWGYMRQANVATLAAALRAVEQGLTVLDPTLSLAVRTDRIHALLASEDDLSPREREVLELIGLGLPNKTIGHRLGISESTAKFHVASVLAKLGAATRAEAVRIGASRGLLAL